MYCGVFYAHSFDEVSAIPDNFEEVVHASDCPISQKRYSVGVNRSGDAFVKYNEDETGVQKILSEENSER